MGFAVGADAVWPRPRGRCYRKAGGGGVEVRLRRTVISDCWDQATTVFDGLAWSFSLKSGLRPGRVFDASNT